MAIDFEAALRQSAIHEDIRLTAYDPRWPLLFLKEKERLMGIFSADLLQIEHIGSTAVPGLSAKPIIDMMAAVVSMESADYLLGPLREFGYVTPANCNDDLVERRWLMRHANGHRTHHLHMVAVASHGWQRTVKFRNLLRENLPLAKKYEELKQRLAATAGKDRDAYAGAKTAFIKDALGE